MQLVARFGIAHLPTTFAREASSKVSIPNRLTIAPTLRDAPRLSSAPYLFMDAQHDPSTNSLY